ncbi:hypothetical protein CDEST_14251 [Colletotrichum destructivum]|uniref:Integral membrane protein n=1 Tax=Colletotrichum destructivum TaxID=34406 RepID=A0AAX4J1H7_9PEZI|nr:hypothetical protein CDEST_14251 [Colletotrichum destructivum]
MRVFVVCVPSAIWWFLGCHMVACLKKQLLTSKGADPLDLQLWYALESVTAFTVKLATQTPSSIFFHVTDINDRACVPYIRLMMIGQVFPYLWGKVVAWVLPSEQPSSSQRTILRPPPTRRETEETSSVQETRHLQPFDVGGLLSTGDCHQCALPCKNEPQSKNGLSQRVETSETVDDTVHSRDENECAQVDAAPDALRRYGFVNNTLEAKSRLAVLSGNCKKAEADRQSL